MAWSDFGIGWSFRKFSNLANHAFGKIDRSSRTLHIDCFKIVVGSVIKISQAGVEEHDWNAFVVEPGVITAAHRLALFDIEIGSLRRACQHVRKFLGRVGSSQGDALFSIHADHVKVDHGDCVFQRNRRICEVVITSKNPSFFSGEPNENDTPFQLGCTESTGQFHDCRCPGRVVVGTVVNRTNIGSARTEGSHAQMVVMCTDDNCLFRQRALCFQDADDITDPRVDLLKLAANISGDVQRL